MTVTHCPTPGCPGTIDETGFCDECGLAPVRSGPVPAPSQSVSAKGSTQSSVGGDPYSLPVFSFPDPSSRIMSDPQVPERERVCANAGCRAPVGTGHAGQPALAQGFCAQCGLRYSFLPSLREGDVVGGQYRVIGCFARGGLGWVYLANDLNLEGNLVVLKGLIDASDASLAVAEQRALTMLDHPNIVRIFNFVRHPDPHTDEQRDYIVMEYVDGLPLRQVCDEARSGNTPLGEPFLVEHVISCGLQILAAFEYLHGRQLLYCDMKPDNVIMRSGQHGERVNRVKLIDLGAVRGLGDDTSSRIGTPPYEVHQREILDRGLTVRSDLHTVGKTLSDLFKATVDAATRTADNPIEMGLASFQSVIARATAEYERRFASAAEMADQLRGVYRRIAALRDGRPRPEPSTVFAQTAALLDAGLGTVPPLDSWVDGGRPRRGPARLPAGTPTFLDVATGLPVPYVDQDDSNADFLADVDATDARGLLGKLAGLNSVEVDIARCRAHLELSELTEARDCLANARKRGPDAWRVRWHDGLVALAGQDVAKARECFTVVHAALPGEDTPLLAIAYCLEVSGDHAEADKYYRAVWRRDRAQASAAFGLARLALAKRNRQDALAVLAAVPRYSRHAEAAAIAQVLIVSHPVPDDPLSEKDLAQAAAWLPGLHLDGGDPDGDARARLTAVVREAVRCWLDDNDGRLPVDGGAVFGKEPDETATRRRLEQSYQALARQARAADDHGVLVDRANEIRPFTFL